MNNRVKYLIIPLAVLLIVPVTSYATDDKKKQEEHKNDVSKEDSIVFFEDDTKLNGDQITIPDYTPAITSTPEQVTYKPYQPQVAETEKVDAEAETNSPMSFNIIYYIIDKFKFTDPLD